MTGTIATPGALAPNFFVPYPFLWPIKSCKYILATELKPY